MNISTTKIIRNMWSMSFKEVLEHSAVLIGVSALFLLTGGRQTTESEKQLNTVWILYCFLCPSFQLPPLSDRAWTTHHWKKDKEPR